MNEAVIKEEVIEEEHNFTFKNGEYVEAKQEEIEQKPEYLLEKEIKTERNDDFFENNYAGRFFEDVKQEPKESDSKIEKVCRTSSMMTCKICQSRMPRNLLKLIKTEDEKTVLSHIFNIEGLMEMNPMYVCVSHIQKIIDDYTGNLKLVDTAFQYLLCSFMIQNKYLMKVSTSQRRYCHICRLPKELSKIHQFCSKGFRMVIIVGCILRGTHSYKQAISFMTTKKRVVTCHSHCKESIDMIFLHLGVRNIQEFRNSPAHAMDGLMEIVKNIDLNFTAEEIVFALNQLFEKMPKS
ncbi:hypothetical protein L3Y34_009530 [Caenorhabditis briggsae]|uniref:Lin-15A/B-like domain-containing protein n=1 Tax=Caenorhabditis briggsae TaxID=6238 RepID=A0AAE9ACD4_CAEBR|nr:hypothetical protein L3Y34_009530 [Caenorhabditis briggsae]